MQFKKTKKYSEFLLETKNKTQKSERVQIHNLIYYLNSKITLNHLP